MTNRSLDKQSKQKSNAALEASFMEKSKSNDSLVEHDIPENEKHETTRWCKYEDFVKHCDSRNEEK